MIDRSFTHYLIIQFLGIIIVLVIILIFEEKSSLLKTLSKISPGQETCIESTKFDKNNFVMVEIKLE